MDPAPRARPRSPRASAAGARRPSRSACGRGRRRTPARRAGSRRGGSALARDRRDVRRDVGDLLRRELAAEGRHRRPCRSSRGRRRARPAASPRRGSARRFPWRPRPSACGSSCSRRSRRPACPAAASPFTFGGAGTLPITVCGVGVVVVRRPAAGEHGAAGEKNQDSAEHGRESTQRAHGTRSSGRPARRAPCEGSVRTSSATDRAARRSGGSSRRESGSAQPAEGCQ